ncbi:unnamed protein product [Penicillium egyptiacum]|uniref:Uncharacterized protein n=1 Tax=Penicillium egyptiacum TaxID=1303716 RepID=A0A9W4KGN2_9EURO|nr:unnamed protein product [Penicillium egyptiacum]
MTVVQASQVKLSPEHLGFARINAASPAGVIETANELLQQNHDKYTHISAMSEATTTSHTRC